MRRKKKRSLPAEGNLILLLFFAGFTLGILFMNVWWNMEGAGAEAGGLYGLAVLMEQPWKKGDYFLYLLKRRGSLFLLAALSGITVFGVPVAAVGVLGTGMALGSLISLGLLEVGLKGGVLVLGIFFPQLLLYMPGILGIGILTYRSSLQGWKSREIPLALYRRQLFWLGGFLMLCLAGMFLEAYVNPEIVTFFIKRLKIF
ncbi:MAG TPA: stage II sporulation protein M [Candidatus Blautia gallistercoris]|uniref:Stage II sporulation protein M n=1 Tax=Candidatus Blautia gallistercoris TaxID=2838490 RepID=A0A9D2B1Y0_9FIRM|nr:stage II sporulation protein M [Candidatus Blautia gallistercoris]